jgi:ribosomal protein S18 acetylase RimI-like enzyme
LQLLGREVDNHRFLLDGLCVSDQARGQGVGTALLEAVVAEARQRGYRAVRLDVVDTNPRARALYERRGFVLDRTAGIGPLRLIFGFRSAHTMVRPI